FMLVRMPGEPVQFLDYRELSPRAIRTDLFLTGAGRDDTRTIQGALSVGVPGTVAGLSAAHVRYGRLAWPRLLGPGIELAERGHWLSARQAAYLGHHHELLLRYPSTARYFTDGGRPYEPAIHWRQSDLAGTLRQLAEHGAAAFYEGGIAQQ